MDPEFSYAWYITRFENAKDTAEEFILSVDEAQFSQPPAEGRWSIAEIYSHLINYGNLYFDNLAAGITDSPATTQNPQKAFPPRWVIQKLINFFDPPYKIKLKTVKAMKPDSVSGYNRMELLIRVCKPAGSVYC
ncbi:MAG: DinB family protein [Fodinibius sp.]|nr:DinB family protein [Fodinibius sp.]